MPEMTEDQLVASFLQSEQATAQQLNGGVQPPPLPGQQAQPQMIEFAGEKIPFGDMAQLQAALARKEQALAAEFQALRNRPPQQQVQQQTQQQPVVLPKAQERWDIDGYAEALKKDPIAAHDLAMGQALNLPPGTGASEAMKLMAQGLSQLKQQNDDLAKKYEQAQARGEETRALAEARTFRDNHPEWVNDNGNFAILERYRNEYGLQQDAKGWEAAFTIARAQQAPFKLNEQQQQQQFQPQQQQNPGYQPQGYQPPQQTGLPSLRQTGSNDQTPALAQFQNYLDSLPEDKWRDARDRFISQSGGKR